MATAPWRALGKCRLLMNAAKAKVPTASAAKVPAASKTNSETPSAKPLRGIMKPMPVSPILQDFIGGAPEASRPEVTKKIWAYIKLHNLQNASDKRQIVCDEKLKTLFGGKDTVGFLEIARLLSPHFVKAG